MVGTNVSVAYTMHPSRAERRVHQGHASIDDLSQNSRPAPWPLAANRVLAALSDAERRRMLPLLQPIRLRRGAILYEINDEIGHAFFPVSGFVSLVGMTESGGLLQVAAVDAKGFVGVPLLLHERLTPHQAVVHVACDAYRLRATALLEECRRNPDLQRVALQVTHQHVTQIAQSSLCHRFHTILQRLSRWLLVYAQCLQTHSIDLTQDRLAQVLGCPRSTVSTAAVALQDKGHIRLRHGRIRILDRAGLRATACECAHVGPDEGS
jgi:CRP-like cAMP-binding protein